MEMFQAGLILLFGAILGSFLNVCIYRLPRGESIASPSSRCPVCQSPIPFLHNIPIISYFVLRGRCGSCKARIPTSYVLVEVGSALLLVFVWWDYGFNLTFLHYSFLALLLLTISIIDVNHKLILNVLTLPGIVIGLSSSIFINLVSIKQALLGMLLGGGFLWLIAIVGKGLFKKDSMGGGDIKLGAMIGSFIGPQVVIALFLSFFLAMPVIAIGLGCGRLRLGGTLPFGPFISLATVILVFFGPTLYDLYYRLFVNL
ncbi:prepilin peptidase [bacterium]|nr:prepilin peptidase [bacterium]